MYKVLIVDDKEIVRRELKRLKIWGIKSDFIISSEATNGQEALDIIDKNPVDFILTDIRMPKVDGIELLREIVERRLCTCVVLLSDYREFSYARQGIVLGAFDYISKPVCESEMENVLKRAKEFLDGYYRERERVKQLEVIHSEHRKVYSSVLDAELIWELIKEQNPHTIATTSQMIDQLWTNLKGDINSFVDILKNVNNNLMLIIIGVYPWCKKFIDLNLFHNYHFLNDYDSAAVKSKFLDKISEVMQLLSILGEGTNEKGIESRVCNYVLNHIEEDISLTEVANKLYMNRTYLSETFKQRRGISFTEYVTNVKMERAKYIIQKENLKSYEIAEKLGFKDAEYFSKVFKKNIGMTPTEYRKRKTS